MEKSRDMSKCTKKASPATEKMVMAIANGNNVDAYKLLERRMREKVAERIDAALKDE